MGYFKWVTILEVLLVLINVKIDRIPSAILGLRNVTSGSKPQLEIGGGDHRFEERPHTG
jgi:hypothetical protein